jgi:hypothetical protein
MQLQRPSPTIWRIHALYNNAYSRTARVDIDLCPKIVDKPQLTMNGEFSTKGHWTGRVQRSQDRKPCTRSNDSFQSSITALQATETFALRPAAIAIRHTYSEL